MEVSYEIAIAKKTNNRTNILRKTSRMFALSQKHRNMGIKVRI